MDLDLDLLGGDQQVVEVVEVVEVVLVVLQLSVAASFLLATPSPPAATSLLSQTVLDPLAATEAATSTPNRWSSKKS